MEGHPNVHRSGRKLAAIMFTDMVGYSSLSQRDEKAAIQLLDKQAELLKPILDVHSGRLVRTMGDGTFVEFDSAVNACLAALEIQSAIGRHNGSAPEKSSFQIRIGIHLGDVEVVGDDLLGHGVNVAARIESLAEAGGICVSEDVARQVRSRVRANLISLGSRSLKGIGEPIQVYSLVPEKENSLDTSSTSKSQPKVAVLPLATQGGDPENEFFGDGLAEEILWALAKVRSLRSVSRTSCFAMKGTSMRVGEIGRALGVDYVLEGSVRRSGNRLRIAVQFVRIADDQPVWSERYDRDLEDIFAIQEEITQSVVDVLQIALSEAERGAIGGVPTQNLRAYDCYLKSNLSLYTDMAASVAFAQEAVALDPFFVKAHSALAIAAWRASIFLMGDGTDYPTIAHRSALRAMELDPNLAESQLAMANSLSLEERHLEVESHLERAAMFDPQNFFVQHFWATHCHNQGRVREACDHWLRAAEVRADDYQCLILAGERLIHLNDPTGMPTLEEGLARIRRHISYDPTDARALVLGAGALNHLGQSAEARNFAERAYRVDPSSTTLYNLACLYCNLGEDDRALAMIEEAYSKGLRNPAWIAWMENDPDMAPVRSHPRLLAVVAQMRADFDALGTV